jgi:hypothetical protein
MTRYQKATEKINHLETIAATFDDYGKGLISNYVLALTTIRDGYTLEEAEKEVG